MTRRARQRISIPSRVLLFEIERRCSGAHCNAKARIGLTKEEARLYCGFECEQCKLWNADALTERDVPDWWEELTITDLHTVRQQNLGTNPEPGEVVARLSEDYRRMRRRDEG